MKRNVAEVKRYVTKDGSLIRELLHPQQDPVRNQSLAEAEVLPGQKTQLHKHHMTEEIYCVTSGVGIMTLGEQQFEVSVGDSVLILPGTPHAIENRTPHSLKVLCCCAPAYSHEDTELL